MLPRPRDPHPKRLPPARLRAPPLLLRTLASTCPRSDTGRAQVGSLTYCGLSGTVNYALLGPGSHWCGRIGRAHRSNRVTLRLNFVVGDWCQKCFGGLWRVERQGEGGEEAGAVFALCYVAHA